MSELKPSARSYSGALLAVLAVSLFAAIGGLIWSYTLSNKLSSQETALLDAQEQGKKTAGELRETNARLKVATDELSTSLGLTQKQLDTRAAEILARETRNEASAQQLASAQKQTAQQVSAVSTEV